MAARDANDAKKKLTDTLNQAKAKASQLSKGAEKLIADAKQFSSDALSSVGSIDTTKVTDFAKKNWKTALVAAAAVGVGTAILKGRKKSAAAKKTAKPVKKAARKTAKKAVKTAKKAVKKTAKKAKKK